MINKEDAKRIFSWLRYKIHEVNIEEEDIALIDKISPLLPSEYSHMIDSIKQRYKEQ